ncbi:FKBP-type peptidyl-prolyl cis-trans isomerase [Sporichthya brevicatena]|uniref:peptidylprolyl isomerase n=1 Tax=Sporichthya brevicatena TaxID=171442 RepID=A0ABN1GY81_9ACTN
MRRAPTLLLAAALLLPAACGGGDEDGGGPNASRSVAPFAFPTVSETKPGAEPKIVSSTAPPDTTQSKVLFEGKGRPVGPDDVVVVRVKGQVWDTDGVDLPAFVNSFSTGQALIRPVDSVVPAWEKVLPGVKVGSRVLIVAPPADGFGDQGNSGVGIFPDDTLMFVLDVLDSVAPGTMATGKPVSLAPDPALPTVTGDRNPRITVPKSAAPADLVERLLRQGSGAKIAEGETILAQYVGVLWRDGKVFDSSWEKGRHPFAARIAKSDPQTGESGVIEGWVKSLVGERVGSRILLVVPPKYGYGKAGNPEGGIKGTDTLVFVIDILGVYGKATT